MTHGTLRIVSEEGALVVRAEGGAEAFRTPNRGYRLGEAMELLERINLLRGPDGRPLHALLEHAGHSLWACWQNALVYPFLVAYTQFPNLFAWMESRGWPVLEPAASVPTELARTLRGLVFLGNGRSPAAVAAAGRVLPALWARSARKRGARVLLYTPDIVSDKTWKCDFRFAKVHQWLSERGVASAEIFHLTDAKAAWRNARARGRLPLFLELWNASASAASAPMPALDTAGLPPPLRSFLARVLPAFVARCRHSAARVEGLRSALRASGARVLLSMDDYRSSQELLLACRLEGVRSVWIQHGLLTRFHPGLVPAGIPEASLPAPDRFLARAPFWKDVLAAYAPRLARVAQVVSGLDAPGDGASGAPPRVLPEPGKPLVVLFLLETLWDPAEAARFLGRMLDDPRLRVHFKIRPDMDRERQVRPYFGSREPHEVALDLGPELARAHVVVGSHSSLLYKLLEWRKPVFRLLTSFEYGEQLSRFGLVDDLAVGDDYHARFTEALARDPEVYERRFAAYQGTSPQEDFRTALARELDLTGG